MSWKFDSLGWAVRWGSRASRGDAPPSAQPARTATAEELARIRLAMLEALGPGRTASRLHLRVATACDAWVLWDLRNELLATLAARDGEAAATRTVTALTPLFQGLLPAGLARNLASPGPTRH